MKKAIQTKVSSFAKGDVEVKELHPNNYIATYTDKNDTAQKILLQVDTNAELVHVYQVVSETLLNGSKLCTVDVIKAHVNVWSLEVNGDKSIRRIGNSDNIHYVFSTATTQM